MLKIIESLLTDVETLKTKVTDTLSGLHSKVSSATEYTYQEIAAAEKTALGSLELDDLTVTRAFSEGAKWMASRFSTEAGQEVAQTAQDANATQSAAQPVEGAAENKPVANEQAAPESTGGTTPAA